MVAIWAVPVCWHWFSSFSMDCAALLGAVSRPSRKAWM